MAARELAGCGAGIDTIAHCRVLLDACKMNAVLALLFRFAIRRTTFFYVYASKVNKQVAQRGHYDFLNHVSAGDKASRREFRPGIPGFRLRSAPR
jgi:hypothetical protein